MSVEPTSHSPRLIATLTSHSLAKHLRPAVSSTGIVKVGEVIQLTWSRVCRGVDMRLAFSRAFSGFVNKSGISKSNLRQILAVSKFASRKTLRKLGKKRQNSLSTLLVDKTSDVEESTQSSRSIATNSKSRRCREAAGSDAVLPREINSHIAGGWVRGQRSWG